MAVGSDEIRLAAARYLNDEALTVGWSLPRVVVEPAALVEGPVPLAPAAVLGDVPARGKTDDEPADHRARPSDRVFGTSPVGPGRDLAPRGLPAARVVLDNGLKLVFERRPGSGVVALELYVDAGSVREAKPGLAALTGRLLEEGTATRSAEKVAESTRMPELGSKWGSTGGSAGLAPKTWHWVWRSWLT